MLKKKFDSHGHELNLERHFTLIVEQFLGHETFSDFKINSDESLEINISDRFIYCFLK